MQEYRPWVSWPRCSWPSASRRAVGGASRRCNRTTTRRTTVRRSGGSVRRAGRRLHRTRSLSNHHWPIAVSAAPPCMGESATWKGGVHRPRCRGPSSPVGQRRGDGEAREAAERVGDEAVAGVGAAADVEEVDGRRRDVPSRSPSHMYLSVAHEGVYCVARMPVARMPGVISGEAPRPRRRSSSPPLATPDAEEDAERRPEARAARDEREGARVGPDHSPKR